MEQDHIPLKDQFSVDESEIDIDEKEEDLRQHDATLSKNKKIRKKTKNFIWKFKWIKIPNAIPNSAPIVIRKWVKIKLDQQASDN